MNSGKLCTSWHHFRTEYEEGDESNEPTYKSFNDDLDDGGLGCFHIEDESADCKFCTPRGGGTSGGGGAHDSIDRVGCYSEHYLRCMHAVSTLFLDLWNPCS